MKNIFREVPKLSTHAPEVFARLGRKYLGIKNKRTWNMHYWWWIENAFAQIIIDIAIKYDIPLVDIRNTITATKLTEESYKEDKGVVRLLSGNHEIVADRLASTQIVPRGVWMSNLTSKIRAITSFFSGRLSAA